MRKTEWLNPDSYKTDHGFELHLNSKPTSTKNKQLADKLLSLRVQATVGSRVVESGLLLTDGRKSNG